MQNSRCSEMSTPEVTSSPLLRFFKMIVNLEIINKTLVDIFLPSRKNRKIKLLVKECTKVVKKKIRSL